MDHDPAELSRERAVSSEPCSTRPNPFEAENGSARKRRRFSRGGSRSRSVDTARDSDIVPDSRTLREDIQKSDIDIDPAPPRTPTRIPSDHPPPEPTSSRVTINLRTARPLESIPSSPPSPATPSKMVNGGEDGGTRFSVESESDALSTVADAALETPSSSPSPVGSPEIELITINEDDGDYESQSPPVVTIDADEYGDPMLDFPYLGDESLVSAVQKVSRFLQYDEVPTDDAFCKLRDWMERYLTFANTAQIWYESYTKYRDFWQEFPQLIWAFNSRSRFFGPFLQRVESSRRALTDVFCQFARIAGRFVAMDVKTLYFYEKQGESDQDPDLGSRAIIHAYSFLLRKEEQQHIGRNLETHYSWNWDDDVSCMTANFQAEGGTLPNLTKLVAGQLKLMSRIPKIIDALTEPCRLAAKVVTDAAEILDGMSRHQYTDGSRQQITEGCAFFSVMSAGLESIIEKHVTFLTADAANVHLASLSEIFRKTLNSETDAARELIEYRRKEIPEIPKKQVPKVMSYEWRFKILKKLITSTQMQLRVVGVTTMCTDLLHIYNTSKGDDPSRSPVLLFFANYVIEHKLIEYIVGIGSHPEIINESNNILGFLIVTKTYTKELTDKIWQTVTTSQDPRVVEAILRMLRQCLNLHDYRSLLYFCEKASGLPTEAFTLPIREFCHNLFQNLITKGGQEGFRLVLDAPPYELCVRLIRESSIITPECPTGHPEIQNFAAQRLYELLNHGPSGEIRNSIYKKCIEDVSLRSSTAPGSICVINGLLRRNLATDLPILTAEHGLTKLVIEELEHTIVGDRHSSVRTSPATMARRELLLCIIMHEPATITPDLGRRLWDHLVGSESRNMTDRNSAWQMLNNAARTPPKNAFIATCFKEYLPNLPPDRFTPGALDFARSSVASWLGERVADPTSDQSFESYAVEQIWQMILTAPPNTIDAPAIGILVELYVDSILITSVSRPRARVIHLALVDRCLRQLAAAALKLKSFGDGITSGDEDGMVIVPSEAQFKEQEIIFARSLAVLREFLKSYQSKPHFAPLKTKASLSAASSKLEGEPLTVKYQSFDGNTATDIQTMTLGTLNTAAALFARLSKVTGFKNYKVYCGGKEVDLDEIEITKSLEDLNLNGLVLVHRRDDDDGSIAYSDASNTTLESEIMKHFDQLWDYLSMHEEVAREIYFFLIKFPVSDRMTKRFEDASVSYAEIFPQGQPFKSMYAIHALRDYISFQAQKGPMSGDGLTRAISLIVDAISDKDVLGSCTSGELRDWLALHLVDCLLQFLKEPVIPSNIAPHLNENLLGRLLQILYDAKSVLSTPNSIQLTFRAFEALLEASLHSSEMWSPFAARLEKSTILRDLLLEDSRSVIRKNVGKQIVNRCTFGPSLAQVSSTDFSIQFWPIVASLILEAEQQPEQCEEIFLLGASLFKKLAETSIDFLDMNDLIQSWGKMLLSHECKEIVGHPESVDIVANGLTNLLFCAASFAKASQQSLSCSYIGTQLFHKHLFPDMILTGNSNSVEICAPRIPLLNPVTRHTMSEAVFLLVKDDPSQCKKVLEALGELVPYDDSLEDGPYLYEQLWMFERSKAIRSPTGYVGLRNLSNTCYLNSLFTQLFMNVPFRDFMINSSIADGGSSQRLLFETQTLFGYMQNSLQKYVDPTNVAGSIRTYEETAIDISIQMDVDEFYNLLFDRWESQILSPEAKKKFRSFYGGQLVQQVKSKECSHISERLELFSAIQCDIKGKTSLQESLQAYVDGEVMEGDNKYKCSTCDRHVDAVKRACLKDIPDNLIFHLKRFDFNLRTLQRSKINDHFAFPRKIDMRPYKVEHLMDNPEETPEDIFELVGVLVHAGTAESGHYYSFIRERPTTNDKDSWVEFNDDSVTQWDPNCIEGACFGGVDYRTGHDNGNMSYDKSYSAYMLFYQRSSVLAAQKQELEASQLSSPITTPLPASLANTIAGENELVLRKYCLYDPSHINFVSKMLSNSRKFSGGRCSHTHKMEKRAIWAAMAHLDQVVARAKDTPDFPNFILAIRQMCYTCADCCRDYLEWYHEYPEGLRQLLLRNPDQLVRSEIASSILSALLKVKNDNPTVYGLGDEGSLYEDDDMDIDQQLIQKIVRGLTRLYDAFHTNCRAWPEYFGLLASIAGMGDAESALLLDAGFLRKTLEIVSADTLLNLSPQLTRMLNIVSKRFATRPVSFECVIGLLYRLLQICDPAESPLLDHTLRVGLLANAGTVPLTTTERDHLTQHWTRSNSHILVEKLLQINQNAHATKSILIILLHWPEDDLDIYIYQAIIRGIRPGASTITCSPFLRAALVYCEHTEHLTNPIQLVEHIAKVANHLDNTEGKEFLRFFKDIGQLSKTNNPQLPPEELLKVCIEQVKNWGPGLLTYYDRDVRADTEDFIHELITSHGPEPDFGTSPEDVEKASIISDAAQKLAISCLDYLHETYVRQRQQAVRNTLQSIHSVMERCEPFFDEDKEDIYTRRYFDLRTTVLPALKKYIVEEADEEVSDWAGSDEEYGSSEPMGESIADLPLGEDLDHDLQL
ncbi:ubiquitin C-terminal hydrolase-like protein [Halenospora varia]|nr:ubiquitin C-terminal hydrolase-like protein [Halenospora varia]